MKREQFISVVFLLFLLFVVVQIFKIFSVFFDAILGGAIIAFIIFPLYDGLRKLLGGHNTVAAALITVLVFLVTVPPLITIVVNLTAQIIQLSQDAYTFVREGKLELWIEHLRAHGWVQKIELKIGEWDVIKANAIEWLLSTAKQIGNLTATKFASLTKDVFSIALNIFFMLFLVFIFLRDGEKIYKFIYRAAPFEAKTRKAVFDQIKETFEAVIRGQILTSFAQAVVAGMIYWALGIPGFLFFAVLTFIFSLIPTGSATIWFPLSIYLFFTAGWIKALILFICGVAGISFIDNLIKPAVIGEKTKLPYFLLLFGILGGLAAYGFIGVFIAPVVLSLFFAVIKIYRAEYLENSGEA